jgi:phytanoyl-CoA hydroxylase
MLNNSLVKVKTMFDFNPKYCDIFNEQGYLLIPNFIERELADSVANRFPLLFRGDFETTVPPDEWRWAEGRDPNDVTRMIWNGWKSDRTVARLSLAEKVGFYCAKLAGWTGARLNQDGCLWKPAGAKGLAFHQDIQYIHWVVPTDMVTCWIALDEVDEQSGTLEYVPESHQWPLIQARPDDFHDTTDHQYTVRNVAKYLNKKYTYHPVQLPPGGAAFHHCRLWHGSGRNISSKDRRALALHCMPDIAEFHSTQPAFAQGRFRKFDSNVMEEDFYPVLWSENNGRSHFIEKYLSISPHLKQYRSHIFTRSAP